MALYEIPSFIVSSSALSGGFDIGRANKSRVSINGKQGGGGNS